MQDSGCPAVLAARSLLPTAIPQKPHARRCSEISWDILLFRSRNNLQGFIQALPQGIAGFRGIVGVARYALAWKRDSLGQADGKGWGQACGSKRAQGSVTS